jgi:hypothetical protein
MSHQGVRCDVFRGFSLPMGMHGRRAESPVNVKSVGYCNDNNVGGRGAD